MVTTPPIETIPLPPAPGARWKSFSRRHAYLGALLGLGSPLGLLLVRYYLEHRASVNHWLAGELRGSGEYYIYAGVGTVLAMALWGLWSGRGADAQRTRAAALERAALRLRDMANTDGLTGVYVRRHLLEKLDEELRAAAVRGDSVASLFIDVDNFKVFNESQGHVIGDEVLRRVAQAIRAGVRERDVVGRYGGDEFLVLLPRAGAHEALRTAERVRQAVEKLEVTDRAGTRVPMTVSVGVVASVPSHGDVLQYLDLADQALRRSKGLGKNCILLCDTPPVEGKTKETAS
jgi:diguanylate cyclase (GGDEF)-like protein